MKKLIIGAALIALSSVVVADTSPKFMVKKLVTCSLWLDYVEGGSKRARALYSTALQVQRKHIAPAEAVPFWYNIGFIVGQNMEKLYLIEREEGKAVAVKEANRLYDSYCSEISTNH